MFAFGEKHMLEEFEIASLMARPDLPRIVENINLASRDEQRRRENFREDLSPSVKAEFIGGSIVSHTPARAKHLRVTNNLVSLLRNFVMTRGLGEVFTEKALVCLTRNDYEPDICFFGLEKAVTFNDETMQFPVPDFVVEVLSDSTEHRDRGVKWDDYGLHGIKEYWIIDCDEQAIEQYLLRGDETTYHLARKLTDGEIESVVVPGFRIAVSAVFNSQQNQLALKKLLDVNSI
jgi:Uma2 family endonuclease